MRKKSDLQSKICRDCQPPSAYRRKWRRCRDDGRSVLCGTVSAHGEVFAPGKSGMSANVRRKRLAIVGAGPSGLAAAWRLRDVPEIDVTVFEKSNGVFGRAATRTRHGVRLDPGANYFRTDLPEIASMVHS
jgi:NADPH-dependent 2,4-dienoyl-CoA reductase/sulfur reductase-like enzyme